MELAHGEGDTETRQTVTGFVPLRSFPRPGVCPPGWKEGQSEEPPPLRRDRAMAAINTITMLSIHQAICLLLPNRLPAEGASATATLPDSISRIPSCGTTISTSLAESPEPSPRRSLTGTS